MPVRQGTPGPAWLPGRRVLLRSAMPLDACSLAKGLESGPVIQGDESIDPGFTPEGLLLQRYAAGEGEVLNELVEAHQEAGFWIARHVVGDDDVASDVVQEAFLRVLRRPQLYDPKRPFKAWFLQIVRHLAIDWLRRKRARTTPLEAEIATVEDDAVLERSETAQNIQDVLACLSDQHRELIILRDVEGYAPEEIARLQEADPGTTRWRIHQARKKFRALWIERYGLEGIVS